MHLMILKVHHLKQGGGHVKHHSLWETPDCSSLTPLIILLQLWQNC